MLRARLERHARPLLAALAHFIRMYAQKCPRPRHYHQAQADLRLRPLLQAHVSDVRVLTGTTKCSRHKGVDLICILPEVQESVRHVGGRELVRCTTLG